MAADTKQKRESNDVSEKTERKSLVTAFNETKIELKKVHWPKQEELKKYTVVVIATVLFFSIAIYIIDSGLGFVISKLVSK